MRRNCYMRGGGQPKAGIGFLNRSFPGGVALEACMHDTRASTSVLVLLCGFVDCGLWIVDRGLSFSQHSHRHAPALLGLSIENTHACWMPMHASTETTVGRWTLVEGPQERTWAVAFAKKMQCSVSRVERRWTTQTSDETCCDCDDDDDDGTPAPPPPLSWLCCCCCYFNASFQVWLILIHLLEPAFSCTFTLSRFLKEPDDGAWMVDVKTQATLTTTTGRDCKNFWGRWASVDVRERKKGALMNVEADMAVKVTSNEERVGWSSSNRCWEGRRRHKRRQQQRCVRTTIDVEKRQPYRQSSSSRFHLHNLRRIRWTRSDLWGFG